MPPTTFLVLSGRCRPSSDWPIVSNAAWRDAAISLTRLRLLLLSTPAAASLYSSNCWLVIIFLLSLKASSFTGSAGQGCDEVVCSVEKRFIWEDAYMISQKFKSQKWWKVGNLGFSDDNVAPKTPWRTQSSTVLLFLFVCLLKYMHSISVFITWK